MHTRTNPHDLLRLINEIHRNYFLNTAEQLHPSCLLEGLSVFCEKPLFWKKNITSNNASWKDMHELHLVDNTGHPSIKGHEYIAEEFYKQCTF